MSESAIGGTVDEAFELRAGALRLALRPDLGGCVAGLWHHGVPVLRTSLMSSTFISRLVRRLEELLSPRATLHGVLIDVLGVGLLLIGRSGVGTTRRGRARRTTARGLCPQFRLSGRGKALPDARQR